MVETPTCTLCDLPTPDPPISDPEVEGSFCCRGCLSVEQALGASDLDREALEESGSSDPIPDTAEACFLSIEGMHCTTCEAFLSGRGKRIPGIHTVEASYATDTARVWYDPDLIDAAALPEALSGYGYTATPRRTGERANPRADGWTTFLVGGGLFGMMVMIWYILFLYPTYFGYAPIVEPGGFDALYIYFNIWLFTTFVLFYTGLPILRGAVVSLLARAPNMDLLVSIAAVSAYGYSTLAIFIGRTDLYFDVSVAIILVVTAGTYYEARVKRRALGELTLEDLDPLGDVTRADGSTVDADTVTVGDKLLVRPGERVPFDGTIREGTAAVDTAFLTGEPVPTVRSSGDTVPGGAIVHDHPIVIEVDEGSDSTHERILSLLWTVQSERPGIQRLVDKLATIFVPLVVVLALVAGGLTFVIGGTGTGALLVGLTVLIVACPCALGLATPLAIAAGVRDGLRRGVLILQSSVFEDARDIDTVVLDKTGTLTAGEMAVRSVHGEDTEAVLSRAAAVEQYSGHPIAEAIRSYAEDVRILVDGGSLAAADVEVATRGLIATIEGERVGIGDPAFLTERGYEIEPVLERQIDDIEHGGAVAVAVGWNGIVGGVIAVGDQPRPDWQDAVEQLSKDRSVVVLTGDDGPAIDRYRGNPAIDRVFAGVPPDGKRVTIERLQVDGPVAMVGDGTNDAPALAAADVGIAVSGATALATDAADVVIPADDLTAVVSVFDLVGGTRRRLRQNLGWAFVYNGIAIPLAVTGLLNPLLAAVAMASSSLLVVTNTARRIDRE